MVDFYGHFRREKLMYLAGMDPVHGPLGHETHQPYPLRSAYQGQLGNHPGRNAMPRFSEIGPQKGMGSWFGLRVEYHPLRPAISWHGNVGIRGEMGPLDTHDCWPPKKRLGCEPK